METEDRKFPVFTLWNILIFMIMFLIAAGIIALLIFLPSDGTFQNFFNFLTTTNFNCTSNDDCVHGECYIGKCFCDLGWSGFHCNISSDICIQNNHTDCFDDNCCNNGGKCWFGKCLCDNGWYGKICENHPCPNITNSNCTSNSDCYYGNVTSGTCYFGKCFCFSNFIGPNCQLERRDLSFCNEAYPCLNGGQCHLNNHDNGECYCPSNTIGNSCEI